MEKREAFGEDYLKSYAEIPNQPVEDESIVARKLSGHLRLFDPQDREAARTWYHTNYEALSRAYGKQRVDSFLQNMDFGIPDSREK